MPKLGMSMTEGTISKWHVSPGTRVSPGDVIADIETSKITSELEVHVEGVIRGELAEERLEFPVGALLGIVAEESVSDEEIARFISDFDPEKQEGNVKEYEGTGNGKQEQEHAIRDRENKAGIQQETKDFSREIDIPDILMEGGDDSEVHATHLARKLARQLGINLNKITGTGRRDRVSKKDIRRAVEAAGGNITAADNVRKKIDAEVDDSHIPATPLARKLAKKQGINLAEIEPTGSRGRVNKADIEKAIFRLNAGRRSEKDFTAGKNEYEEVPLSSMRRTIADRLTRSKQSAPHYRLMAEVNIDRITALRKDLNEDLKDGKISLNDMLIKAVARALTEVPEVNIQFDGKTVRRYKDAEVAVAVALEEGLVTPIIRAANKKDIFDVSNEMTDLVENAKAGTLNTDAFEGGTFTLSNLGMFGIKTFDAIINPPQAAILAVGAGERKRIFSGENEIVATVMAVTLSCDHRVIDGAVGARFLKTLKEIIEKPGKLLL